jgi:hypothetical protein
LYLNSGDNKAFFKYISGLFNSSGEVFVNKETKKKRLRLIVPLPGLPEMH